MKRVMVVDDEKPVIEGISLMIRRELGDEFTIAGTASSGREALERIGAMDPDIVLMDVSMPGLSGLETIRELRDRGSKSVYILVTAYERFDIAREAVELGLGDYLLKPVTRETLASSLRAAGALVDRRREADLRLVEDKERERSLLPFVEASLALGVMFGDADQARREAALRALGIDEEFGRAFAIVHRPAGGRGLDEEEIELLHRRLSEGLRYRSRALIGPPISGTLVILVPSRLPGDRADSTEQAVRIVAGEELADGRLALGKGGVVPWASIGASWSEALTRAMEDPESDESSGARDDSAAETPSLDPAPGPEGGFEEDEAFLAALLDRDEARAAHLLDRLVEEAVSSGEVKASGAGRLMSLFGVAYRRLAQRGLLSREEVEKFYDFGDLAKERAPGPWRLAAHTRLGRLRELVSGRGAHSAPVAKALAYIRGNFQKPIGLESTADFVGLSPNRLSRLLVEETGRGFSDILIGCRIECAKTLLNEPGISIKEVSLASGYSDPNYFARLFRKVTGRSPSSWAAGGLEAKDA